MTKTLPKELTSYDLLKTLALVLMIIDHVGYHFYPDEMWFRVLGRLCVPIWFFLIGYANTTRLGKDLWIGAGIVAVSAVVAGQYLLPLNILFTILILRYFRQSTVLRCFHSPETMRGMFLILLFLHFPMNVLFEYGAGAMMIVLYGFMVRHKESLVPVLGLRYMVMFGMAVFLAFYVLLGIPMPSITPEQAVFMFFGFAVIGVGLWFFRPMEFVRAPGFMAGSFIKLFQFTGRRTLEIYVAHIVIFRGVAMYLYPDEYVFMEWSFAPPGMLAIFGIQ